MYSFMALALAFVCLNSALLANAGLYFIQPSDGSTCNGGQPCTVTWLDDGTRPLLSSVGVATVGLYTGKQKLVQSIAPVDVTTTHSITFTPNPAAGPDSGAYYISITSTTLKGNDSVPYSGFSPFFHLTGMSGSFDSPLPSATSTIPIPASLTHSSSTSSGTSIVTIGTIASSSSAPATTLTFPASSSSLPSSPSSRLTTSVSSSKPTSSSSSSAPSASHTSAASRLSRSLPSRLSMLSLFIVTSCLMLLS